MAVAVSHMPGVFNRGSRSKRPWSELGLTTKMKRGRWVEENYRLDRKPAIKRKSESDVHVLCKLPKKTNEEEEVPLGESVHGESVHGESVHDNFLKKNIEIPEWKDIQQFVEEGTSSADREFKWVQFLENFEMHIIQRHMNRNKERTFDSYIS